MNDREMKMRPHTVLAVLLFATFGIGAKGCDTAVVGEDGSAGQSGAGTGGSDSAGSGGTKHPGSGGSSTPGGGGSGTGGSGTGTGGSGDADCGGLLGEGCADGEYCDFPPDALCGAADATGVCVPKPDMCPLIDMPVCGCDDQTYDNVCAAAMAGVSVAHDGPCDLEPGAVCGGLRGDSCSDGEFCNFPPDALCGWADATGICEPLPEACDAIYDPVCGCDGETYPSDCDANLHGVAVHTEGECEEPSGEICGGITGAGCQAGWFCDFPRDALCGAADQTGVCVRVPEVCTDDDVPVCGCDDRTYSNACIANAAGISVASDGACKDPQLPDFCGGIAGFGCPEGMFCDFPIETQCGQGDMAGECRTTPEACDRSYVPVCGCDGVTYANACVAASAGQSVAAEGECAREE